MSDKATAVILAKTRDSLFIAAVAINDEMKEVDALIERELQELDALRKSIDVHDTAALREAQEAIGARVERIVGLVTRHHRLARARRQLLEAVTGLGGLMSAFL